MSMVIVKLYVQKIKVCAITWGVTLAGLSISG